MFDFLNRIRCVENKISVKRQILNTAGVMLFGIALGIISKYLDCPPSNGLPFVIELLDFTNFFGRFAVWVFLAVCISVYSVSPGRAAVNVFLFFVGMLASYYTYSTFIAGFFPLSYAMVWGGFTVISPLLAFICWYAKGSGKISLVISAGIIAMLFNMTFVYGWIYFDIRSVLELAIFVCGVIVLRRESVRRTVIMTAVGIVIAIGINMIVPFRFG
ncbi:MAG: hypothetical protein Q4G33_03595 [bacterium]|nr:hypothetical protein [bacterium]